MKLFFIASLAILFTTFISCNSNQSTADQGPFCKDSACLSEPLRFDNDGAGKPFVTVSFSNCKIDTIHWEKAGKGGVSRNIIFSEFIPNDVTPSKSYFTCEFIDTKYAWLKFNDCPTGRGYLIKLPFDETESTSKFMSAINDFDPKFEVSDGLIAYYDNTFIYVQDIHTGKIAQTLLTDTGVKGIDYNDVHSLIDTVNISPTNIYVKLHVDDQAIEHNEPLKFEEPQKSK